MSKDGAASHRSGHAGRYSASARSVSVRSGVIGSALLGLLATSGSLASNTPKGDKAFGEYLSAVCVTCHQVSGQSSGGIPPIIAWPEDQFVAVINSYRWKDRENEVMQTVAAQLTDEEILALAAYFGSLPPAK